MFHLLYTFPLIASLVIINLMVFHFKRDVEIERLLYFSMIVASFVPLFNWAMAMMAIGAVYEELVVPSKWFEKFDNWMSNPINPVKK